MPAWRRGARFEIDRAIDVRISEPSDVTTMPGDAFFVVSDVEPAGALVTPAGKSVRIELPDAVTDGESGFEAVSYDRQRKHLLVAREEHHELAVLRWGGTARSRPELLEMRPLPAIGTKKKRKGKKKAKGSNKGIEGMTHLSARQSPTKRAHLVVAKEHKPRAIALLDPDGGGAPIELALDPAIEDACDDFSGLAVDPKSGHLFVCSDESATVAEIALAKGRELTGDLVAVTQLADPDGDPLERVEGIAFDARGDLYVLCENDCVLWRFTRR